MPDIKASLNKLMFISGAVAAERGRAVLEPLLDPGWADHIQKNVTGYYVGNHNTFQTDYFWFLAAAFVEVACICLIAPSYWGMDSPSNDNFVRETPADLHFP